MEEKQVILSYIERKGDIVIGALAKKIGVTKATFVNYINGETELSEKCMDILLEIIELDKNPFDDGEVTIKTILATFANKREEKRLKEIKESVISLLHPSELIIEVSERERIEAEVKKIIDEDKKRGSESYLTYTKNKKYKQRKTLHVIPDPENPDYVTKEHPQFKDYVGAAGECAVMAELMFRGYNANRMMIDEGVDIIATKNNIYYYIQVKTVNAKEGKFYFRIPQYRFGQYVDSQIRYICVGRSGDKLYYFKFTPDNISDFTYNQYIKQSNGEIHINIKFHERSGNPILYSVKEKDISYNMNNFKL